MSKFYPIEHGAQLFHLNQRGSRYNQNSRIDCCVTQLAPLAFTANICFLGLWVKCPLLNAAVAFWLDNTQVNIFCQKSDKVHDYPQDNCKGRGPQELTMRVFFTDADHDLHFGLGKLFVYWKWGHKAPLKYNPCSGSTLKPRCKQSVSSLAFNRTHLNPENRGSTLDSSSPDLLNFRPPARTWELDRWTKLAVYEPFNPIHQDTSCSKNLKD